MSYDLEFDCGPLAERHDITGGTYAMGGTDKPWLNITYNYAPFYYDLWPNEGIRFLYDKTAREIVKELNEKIPLLAGEPSENYWDATPGNARVALESLRHLAILCPPNSKLNGD